MKATVLALAMTCVAAWPLTGAQATSQPVVPPLTPEWAAESSRSMADLGLALLRDQTPSQNSMNSPYSVTNALGMVLMGAAGESQRQLSRALLGDREPGSLAPYMREIDTALNNTPPSVSFRNANRMWVNATLAPTLLPSYAEMTRRYYKSDAVLHQFDNPQLAVKPINAWIEEKTGGKITNMLSAGQLPSSTQMVMVNAVYFNGLWRTPFLQSRTEDAAFSLDEGRTVQVPTMHATVNARTAQLQGVRWLELPYGAETADGEWVMQIAMPRPGQELTQFEQQLTGAQWLAAMNQLNAERLEVALPRFSMKGATSSVRATLMKLGVVDIFSTQADLRNINGHANLSVSDVFHRATIDVDEAGTVASAATALMVTLSSAQVLPHFAVNRPFLFFIVHKPTKTPVFLGRVVNPVLSN